MRGGEVIQPEGGGYLLDDLERRGCGLQPVQPVQPVQLLLAVRKKTFFVMPRKW